MAGSRPEAWSRVDSWELSACRMIASHRLTLALLGLGTIILVGMLGYVLLEGFSPIEALYMTIITISTVGYSEVRPLTPPGMAFTVVLIVTSVGVTFYQPIHSQLCPRQIARVGE